MVTRSIHCAKEGGKNERSRKRRANFYLQLTEIGKANFNKLFELVARISWECDLKEDWQLLYWNMHNGKVFQWRGERGNTVWTIRAAASKAVIRVWTRKNRIRNGNKGILMNIKEQHKLSGIKIRRDKSTACIITTVQYKRQTKFQKYFRSKNKNTEVST